MKWQDDWNEFMQEVAVHFQVRGSSALELTSIFRGKEVNWSGKVVKIKSPTQEGKESHIEVEMSPCEQRLTQLTLVFPYITIHPEKQDWTTLQSIKVGDVIIFTTRVRSWVWHVRLDPRDRPDGPTPGGQIRSRLISRQRDTTLFLFTRGLKIASKSSRNLAELRAKAENNDAQSQYELGEVLRTGKLGVTKDDAEAVKWIRKAAEQNHAEGQFRLGALYAFGRGVTTNSVEAVKWFRKSAEQSNADAQQSLGMCYRLGQGVPVDYAEALKWFRKAAEQDHAVGQLSLASLYSAGQGVERDDVESAKWLRKAAEQNDADGQFYLGNCYRFGRGVTKDLTDAFKWCLLSAMQGNNMGKGAIAYLGSVMTSKQVAEGKRRVVEWLSQP